MKPEASGVAARWYDLGVQLLDKDAGVLDVIKTNHPTDVVACCNRVFKKWLQIQPGASWNQLIIALTNIGLNRVADDIIKLIQNGGMYIAM